MPTERTFPVSQGYGPDHYAYDIAMPTWTPLLAMAAGRVTYAGWDERFPFGVRNGRGYYVDIDHGDGWLSRQIHMAELPMVEVGDWVPARKMIGRSGATGLTGRYWEVPMGPPEPHVHVAVFKDGIPVDWKQLVS